jgi:triosephosphate isomerase
VNPLRRPLVAGNWKMNAGGASGLELAQVVAAAAAEAEAVDVLVCPPFTALAAVSSILAEVPAGKVAVGAQNLWFEASGAFTGEISAAMLKESGAEWTLVGHSERRQLFGETDALVLRKTERALAEGLRPVVCVGETLTEREAGHTLQVVERQVRAVLDLLAKHVGAAAIAYEPVWAIGTGKVAKPEDAEEVHTFIRRLLEQASEELAESTRILYGGSVKAENARGLLGMPNVDGALVGGASLDGAGFGKIVRAAQALADEAERVS